MKQSLNVLEDIRVASPCNVPWNQMVGDDRKRHCGHCNQAVYNLSEMTSAEALELINAEAICVRLFRRSDGKVITRDCPVGRAARFRRTILRGVVAMLSWLSLGFVAGCQEAAVCHQGKPGIGPKPVEQAPADEKVNKKEEPAK